MTDPFSPAGRFEERRRDANQQRARTPTRADSARLSFLDHVIPGYEAHRRIAQEKFETLRRQFEEDDAERAELIDELRAERTKIRQKYKETD